MTEKEWYLNYFSHMQEEHKKTPLGGMAWDDIAYWYTCAIQENIFSEKELKELFPLLF